MALQQFTFESIDQIDDGSVAVAVNQALRAAYLDCADRPELKKPRKVSLEVTVTPQMEKGEFRFAKVAMQIKQSVPSKGIEVVMRPNKKGLEFQPSIPDNPDQIPMFDDNDDDK